MVAHPEIRRVAVLGAGTMGAQIAAFIAGHGIPCDLLDLPSDGDRNRRAADAKQRLWKLKPPPMESVDVLDIIYAGNFADDLPRLGEADWVIEAVVEKLDIKRDLWARAAPYLRPDTLASTNTSGIPISSIAEALLPPLRQRFLGAHFFNPPRYLPLLELIPTPDTDPEVVASLRRIAEDVLGKGVVIAHDVPNFIGNRIGSYGLMVSLRAMEEFGLGPDEVDSITGRAMGRPNSATFRTLDLIGLDIFLDVCNNTRGYTTDPQERAAFDVPPYVREMVARGWTGEKSGQGFYKRAGVDGAKEILALQIDTLEYRPCKRVLSSVLAAALAMEQPSDRLRTLLGADDPAGRFAWRVLSQLLLYATLMVGEVADDIVSIDRSMRWGFGWELGPFETWDALGVAETVERMRRDRLQVPKWVSKLAGRGQSFYRREAGPTLQATPQSTYVPIPEGAFTP